MNRHCNPELTAKQFDELPALLNVEQVAALLGIHPRTVQAKARAGELPGKKIGDKWRFNKERVAQYAGLL